MTTIRILLTALVTCIASTIPLALLAADEGAVGEGAAQRMSRGNGEANWIKTDGLRRDGRKFTVPEVRIDGPGWLVLHPFEDGRPVGEIYVGARYLASGTHENVEISVTTAPEPAKGTMFILMLHSDVDDDGTFDFVFVDPPHVADKAVFEGMTMIAHVISAP